MCGIIGYMGPRDDAMSVIIKGLKKLEYRGYDSWGMGYVRADGTLGAPIKQVGAIGDFDEKSALYKKIAGVKNSFAVIGHTRWATTGKVSKTNAHPHFSNNGKIAVVQNGIVENFNELKKTLEARGFKFKSDTDTEVIANLIEYETGRVKSKNRALFAVRAAFKKLAGRNAIAAIFEETGEMIAARNGSPLIIGVGKNEYFVASDIPAFLEYTNKVIYLDDGQFAIIKNRGGGIEFYGVSSRKKIQRRIVTVGLKLESVDKGKFKHFMIKEIMEQKDTIRRL
ncbi:MAG: glutamine--fructose-6-phosphate aminotransferase, partial [Candidatus Jacksonbacteria bacterium]|nr:glutamine--fructose-6-phosphate aminotransferase [Candidatus Jacksonbacteria bacterium]